MRVLAGCEFSGAVRQAFRDEGHDAWSCDLLPAEDGSPFHFQEDVLGVMHEGWDMAIFFPPCTYLCSSGMHWTTRGIRDRKLTEDALNFVRLLMGAPIKHIAIENPVGAISSRIRKPDQIIHPWQFGHPESKTTCLWLQNLPLLKPTDILKTTRFSLLGKPLWDNQTPSGQNRLGRAMANQWSNPESFTLPTAHPARTVVSHGAQLMLSIMPTAHA